jgi:hypothetical protein
MSGPKTNPGADHSHLYTNEEMNEIIAAQLQEEEEYYNPPIARSAIDAVYLAAKHAEIGNTAMAQHYENQAASYDMRDWEDERYGFE